MKDIEHDVDNDSLQEAFARRDESQQPKIDVNKARLTVNPGDRVADYPQSLEEKAQQLAVDSPDITGEHIRVPTYFIFEFPDGQKKALHHVKDAQQISDLIRIMRLQNDDWW